MTCVAAVVEKGVVYMGADSVGAEPETYHVRRRMDPKVFRCKPFLLGFTGSFRLGQLLAHSLKVPEIPTTGVSHKWMCTKFIDALRECLKAGGWEKKENGREEGGHFLAAAGGKIFDIQSDFQVGMLRYEYVSVGCGRDYAIGSLYSTRGQHPRRRIRQALAAAEEFSGYVRGPYTILRTR